MSRAITIINKEPWAKFITVQVKDDDVLAFCNHAGHRPQHVSTEGLNLSGEWYEYETIMEVCDKCGAQSEDGDDWYEQ